MSREGAGYLLYSPTGPGAVGSGGLLFAPGLCARHLVMP